MYYSLTGIRSRLLFRRLDSLSGTLTAGAGEAITPWYSGRVKNIDIKAELSRKKLVVSKGLITGDSSAITCQGTIPFSSKIGWKAHADVSTFLSPLLCVRKIKGLQAKDEVHAVASLSGLLDSPRISLQVTARKVMFDSIPFETVAATANYAPDGSFSGTLDCASPMGQAGIKANASIPLFSMKPRLETWDAVVMADVPRISDIANRFGLKHALLKGVVHVEGRATAGA